MHRLHTRIPELHASQSVRVHTRQNITEKKEKSKELLVPQSRDRRTSQKKRFDSITYLHLRRGHHMSTRHHRARHLGLHTNRSHLRGECMPTRPGHHTVQHILLIHDGLGRRLVLIRVRIGRRTSSLLRGRRGPTTSSWRCCGLLGRSSYPFVSWWRRLIPLRWNLGVLK